MNSPPAPGYLKPLLWLCIALLVLSATTFYIIQNSSTAPPGGRVAPVKTLWLGTVLLCWYIYPALLLSDNRLDSVRPLIAVFLINMLARALTELGMMYWWQNWHPWYGISHDLFSLLLCLGLAAGAFRRSSLMMKNYFLAMALLFGVESFFAWYMLTHVTSDHGPVFYVPSTPAHSTLLFSTGVIVGITWLFLGWFTRRWLYLPQPPSHSARLHG
ncbi:hypothetical protein [Thiolapillus sp.]